MQPYQYVIRVRRAETATLGPETHLVMDGTGKPILFTEPKDAYAFKDRLKQQSPSPDLTFTVEPFNP
jgi:hypothetical protein